MRQFLHDVYWWHALVPAGIAGVLGALDTVCQHTVGCESQFMFQWWVWGLIFLSTAALSGIWGAWQKFRPFYQVAIELSAQDFPPDPNFNNRQFVGISILNRSGDALRDCKFRIMEIYDLDKGHSLLEGSQFFQWSAKSVGMYRDESRRLIDARQKRETDISRDDPFYADVLFVNPPEQRVYIPVWGDDRIYDDPGSELLIHGRLHFRYREMTDYRDFCGKISCNPSRTSLGIQQLTEHEYSTVRKRPPKVPPNQTGVSYRGTLDNRST